MPHWLGTVKVCNYVICTKILQLMQKFEPDNLDDTYSKSKPKCNKNQVVPVSFVKLRNNGSNGLNIYIQFLTQKIFL